MLPLNIKIFFKGLLISFSKESFKFSDEAKYSLILIGTPWKSLVLYSIILYSIPRYNLVFPVIPGITRSPWCIENTLWTKFSVIYHPLMRWSRLTEFGEPQKRKLHFNPLVFAPNIGRILIMALIYVLGSNVNVAIGIVLFYITYY